MPTPFDPYAAWFGIPPQEQPPNLYRLLGLPPAEADSARILAAIERAEMFLEGQLATPQRPDAERLMAEVSAARSVLLNPAHKANYDSMFSGAAGSRAGAGESGGFKRPAPRGAAPAESAPAPAAPQPSAGGRGPLPMNAPPGLSPPPGAAPLATPPSAPMATLAPSPAFSPPPAYSAPQGYGAPPGYPAQPAYPQAGLPSAGFPAASAPAAPGYGYAQPGIASPFGAPVQGGTYPNPYAQPGWSAAPPQSPAPQVPVYAPPAYSPPAPPSYPEPPRPAPAPAPPIPLAVSEPGVPSDPPRYDGELSDATADAVARTGAAVSPALATWLAIGIGGVLSMALGLWVVIGQMQRENQEARQHPEPASPAKAGKSGELKPLPKVTPKTGSLSHPVGGKSVEHRNPDTTKGSEDTPSETSTDVKPADPKPGETGTTDPQAANPDPATKTPADPKSGDPKPADPGAKPGPTETSPAAPVLAGLPAMVDLPGIGDANAGSLSFGSIALAEGQSLQLKLVDGSGSRGPASFRVAPTADPAKKSWRVESLEGGSPVEVGQIKLQGTDLQFAWSASADPTRGNPLRNAKLWLAVGAERKAITLRKPIEVEPLLFAIEPAQIRHQIPALPDASDIGIEFLGDEGAPRHRFEPAKVTGSKEADIVFTTDTNTKLLVFRVQLSRPGIGQMKIDTRTMAVQGMRLVAFKAASIEKELTLIRQQKVAATDQFLQFQQANRRNKALVDQAKLVHDQQMAAADQQIVALDQLAAIAAEDKQAKFHYRLFIRAGNEEIEIARSKGAPEKALPPSS